MESQRAIRWPTIASHVSFDTMLLTCKASVARNPSVRANVSLHRIGMASDASHPPSKNTFSPQPILFPIPNIQKQPHRMSWTSRHSQIGNGLLVFLLKLHCCKIIGKNALDVIEKPTLTGKLAKPFQCRSSQKLLVGDCHNDDIIKF